MRNLFAAAVRWHTGCSVHCVLTQSTRYVAGVRCKTVTLHCNLHLLLLCFFECVIHSHGLLHAGVLFPYTHHAPVLPQAGNAFLLPVDMRFLKSLADRAGTIEWCCIQATAFDCTPASSASSAHLPGP